MKKFGGVALAVLAVFLMGRACDTSDAPPTAAASSASDDTYRPAPTSTVPFTYAPPSTYRYSPPSSSPSTSSPLFDDDSDDYSGYDTSSGGGAYSSSSGSGSGSSSSSAYYKNCDAARAAGAAPLSRSDPGYSAKLDRDGDGIACE